ncbi:MAG: (2Fe-2S)-binding protein [Clostridia bacterium]
MSNKMKINLKVNGENVTYEIEPQQNLLRVLRDNYIYDVKCGCEEGDCGTCTVLLDGVTVKSCITLAAACDGCEIWTDKGLGYNDRVAARLQAAFVECGSVQCGFCTPGMIVVGVSYLKNGGKPDRNAIKKAISGNLCRCTGYVKIVDAIYKVAKEIEEGVLA